MFPTRFAPLMLLAVVLGLASSRQTDAVLVPTVDQPFAAIVVGGELSLTGQNLGDPPSVRELRFSHGGATTVVAATDPAVSAWTPVSIDVVPPVDVRTGTVSVVVDDVASAPVELRVYEYVSYSLPSPATSSDFPLTLDRDSAGILWVLEEAHSHLKKVVPATATEAAQLSRISIPQAPGAGIFANESNGKVTRTTLSGRAEDLDVDSAGNVWFTQGGGGYVTVTPGTHNSGRVIRYEPATNTFSCWPIPIDYAGLFALFVDEARGRVWYTAEHSDSLWWFDPEAVPSNCMWEPYYQPWPAECPAGGAGACHHRVVVPGIYPALAHIVPGPDGALWFTHYWGSAIGRYDPATGQFSRVPLPPPISTIGPGTVVGSGPWELDFDADDNLWVSEFFDATLVRVRTAAVASGGCSTLVDGANPCVDEVFVGSNGADGMTLHSVTVAAEGDVWFSYAGSVGIVASDQGNAVSIIELPNQTSGIGGIVIDPTTLSAWFTEFHGKRVATLRPAAGDADGVDDVIDNCPDLYNPNQENADDDRIDLAPFGRPFSDVTWPLHDRVGDACDDDADNDGLSNTVEAAFPSVRCPTASGPTSSILRDSDGDLVLDGAECILGADPASAASVPTRYPPNDPDRDFLSTFIEVLLGSNPNAPDTDGDGLLDGAEVRGFGSDPLRINSDGDECSDAKEAASVNSDRRISSGDQVLVASSYGSAGSQYYAPAFDVNRDGSINSTDILFVARQYGSC